MSARRAHAKSRTGCADCKRRRIKCDEGRPACNNCHKRSVRCSFQDFDPVRASAPSIATKSTHERASTFIHVFSRHQSEDLKPLSDDIRSEHTQQQLLEQLPEDDRPQYKHVLAHFATDTVLTLSPGTAAHDAWRKSIPMLAKDYTFVLHGTLAISCLHLSSLAEQQMMKEKYQALAATQMNTGMVQYGKELEQIGIRNAEALLAFSTTLTTFTNYTAAIECREALVRLQHTSCTREESENLIAASVDAICRTFRSIRGVLVILVPCWHHLKAGILEPVVERDWWPPHTPTTPKEVENDKTLRQLETMWSCPGRSYEYFFDTLRAALKSLREAFALVSRLEDYALPGDTSEPKIFDWTSLFDWPVSLSLDFLTQLEQQRWEAWVIVAHHAMLVHRMDHHLWLEGMGINMLSTAALVIGEERWNWLEWPSAVIGIDLQTLRHVKAAS